MSNKPATWELYTLADGQSKVTVTPDTKVPNAATFTIQKEDHTLANVLRNSVLANPKVIFCGYKVPHPLEPYFLLKIQTNGEISPKDVLVNEIKKLIKSVSDLSKSFSSLEEVCKQINRMRTEFRKKSFVQKDLEEILQGEERIYDLAQSTKRNVDAFETSVMYNFYKNPTDIIIPKTIGNVKRKGKMQLMHEIVDVYFPKDLKWSQEYSVDLHHDFLSDFISMYHSTDVVTDKINHFTPETWARLSRPPKAKKEKVDSDLVKGTKLPEIIATVNLNLGAVDKPQDKIHKKIKDVFKKVSKQENIDLVGDDGILSHGFGKVNKRLQMNYEKILSILMDSSSISKVDQNFLNSYLRKFGAFHKLTESVFEKICKCIKLEIVPVKKCIFKQYDPGTSWYIILLGYVRIKVASDSQNEITVATLGPGEGFGEQAIVTDSDRAASAYAASSPTILARIDKSDYKRIMNFIRRMEKKEKVFFLKYMKLLSKFDHIALKNLADRLTLRKFEAGQILIKETEISNSIYFIKSGSASVYRKVVISPTKTREILVGKVFRGDSVNEDVLLDRSNYIGSKVTVKADEPIEFGAVLAYDDLAKFPFTYTRPEYLDYTQQDLLKLVWIQKNLVKFRKLQSKLTRELLRS